MRHVMETFMVVTTWAGVDLAAMWKRRKRESRATFTQEFIEHMEEFLRKVNALEEPPAENPAEC